METINVTRPDEGEHRLAATNAAAESVTAVRISGRDASGKHLFAVEVAVVPDGGPLVLVRHANARDTEARRRAREDAALDAEDVLTQAEEASALNPVG